MPQPAGPIHAVLPYLAALAANPDNPTALNHLAWLLAGEGRALDEAERQIRRAIGLGVEPREVYADTLAAVLRAR